MVVVNEVPLEVTLPDDEIKLVMMQPYVKLDTQSEPFVWVDADKEEQINRIRRTLNIAKQSVNGQGAQFTLFPEYSIPGLPGIKLIDDFVNEASWQLNSIVIAGVDGLSQAEYRQLCEMENTYVDRENGPDKVKETQWVNCVITWVKQSDETVARWVQPKITPSWAEEAITANDMFPGKSTNIFACKFENGTECRFMSLICFDWIGSDAGKMLLWEILKKADDASNPTKKEMNLLFVLQHNPKPNHPTFLENTRKYFDDQNLFPFTPRTQGAVIFANTAGGEKPGIYRSHGFSSIIFSRVAPYDSKACPPSAAVRTKKLRASASLGECQESLLREMGSCIHSIRLTLPQFINLGVADRSLPIRNAEVHPISAEAQDPRTPGASVPAIVKWVNDQLDVIPTILTNEVGHPLRPALEESHREISGLLRQKPDKALLNCMDLAADSTSADKWIEVAGRGPVHLVDYWDGIEAACLKAVVHILSIIRAYRMLEVSCIPAHAVMIIENQVYDLVVINGKTHQSGFEYVKDKLGSSGQRIRIVVTQDSGNTILPDRDKPITSASEPDATKGPNITDPGTSWRHCGHQNIVSACFNSQAIPELTQSVTALFRL